MFHDLARSARDLLTVGPAKQRGPGSLLARVTDLLFYGDFEIFEQVASISDSDDTNLVGYKAGRESVGGLLLSAPIGAAGHSGGARRDAVVPSFRDGRVWGPGAMSGRLALLCQISAAASFRRGELRRPVVVAGTFGQEHRGSGTQYLLESRNFQPEWVVVGAGTNLEIVRAHRGYMVFVVEITPQGDRWRRGFPVRSGHHIVVPGVTAGSVLPGAGSSALARALAILDDLASGGPSSVHGIQAGQDVNRVPSRCEFDLLLGYGPLPPLPPDVTVEALPDDAPVSPAVTDALAAWRTLWERIRAAFCAHPHTDAPEFEPPGPLFNVGHVQTNGGGLLVRFDYRPLPGEDAYAVFQDVSAAVDEAGAVFADEFAYDLSVPINRPPMSLPDGGRVVEAARRAVSAQGLLPVISTLPHYTDGAMYASCDLDAVVIGPGWWADDAAFGEESIPLQHLELAVAIYRDMIRELCG